MNNMKHKILMTLALLLTAVTGAWADGIVCTASDLGKVLCTDGSIYENVSAATTAGKTAAAVIVYVDETNKNGLAIALADEGTMNWSTAKSTCEGKTAITGAKWCLPSQDQWKQMFKANGDNDASYTVLNTTITTAGGTTLPMDDAYWSSSESSPGSVAYRVWLNGGSASWHTAGEEEWYSYRVRACLAFDIAEPDIEVKWDAATKTGTFVMPAFDVELTPVYAPVAAFAVVSEVEQKPTAIEGIIAGEAKDIVKAGTVATTKIGEADPIAQGTVMYAVTTENKKPTSTEGFSATVPTGAVLTGSYAEDQTVYVWYYIAGIDAAKGVTPTAENTFNDSEICETPLTVKLKANQFTLTLNPAPVKNITVTAGTETKTPTTEGKTDIKMNSEVKLKANEGYKIKKVVIKKDPVAEGHALTSAKLGEIVCSDGKAYAAADKDILPKGVKAEALVCYVDGDHGLALAMADVKNEKMSWDNNRGANDGKTAAEWCDGWNTSHPIAEATWLLADQTQWNNMISAAGGASNLSNAFSAVGGTNLQAWSYWSSTQEHGGKAAYMYYFPSSSWQWTYLYDDPTGNYIRACLKW